MGGAATSLRWLHPDEIVNGITRQLRADPGSS
jgi:hypothetical protein